MLRRDRGHIYDSKNPIYDVRNQRRVATDTSPSVDMYYDPGWSDWNHDILATNMLESSLIHQGDSYSVNKVDNPLMVRDADDIFLRIFERNTEKAPLLKTKYFTINYDTTLHFNFDKILKFS